MYIYIISSSYFKLVPILNKKTSSHMQRIGITPVSFFFLKYSPKGKRNNGVNKRHHSPKSRFYWGKLNPKLGQRDECGSRNDTCVCVDGWVGLVERCGALVTFSLFKGLVRLVYSPCAEHNNYTSIMSLHYANFSGRRKVHESLKKQIYRGRGR